MTSSSGGGGAKTSDGIRPPYFKSAVAESDESGGASRANVIATVQALMRQGVPPAKPVAEKKRSAVVFDEDERQTQLVIEEKGKVK